MHFRDSRCSGLWFAILHSVIFFILLQNAAALDSVEQRFLSSQDDPALEEALYYSIGVELVQKGLSSTRTVGGGLYILQTKYTRQGNILSLSLHLFQGANPLHELATLETIVTLDDSFNAQVEKTVRQVLVNARLSELPNDNSQIEGVFPDANPGIPSSAGDLAQGPNAPVTPDQSHSTASGASKAMVLPPILVLDIGVGGTAFFGRLADFTNYGVGGSLKASLAWRWDSLSFLVGIGGTSISALNNSGVTGGPLYCNGLAFGLDLGSGRKQSYRLTGGVSGGAMVLTVGNPPLSKTAPWLNGGASIALPLGAGFFLGTRAQLQAIFETTLIVGLTVTFSVSKEF